jgi:hypothetical protein
MAGQEALEYTVSAEAVSCLELPLPFCQETPAILACITLIAG